MSCEHQFEQLRHRCRILPNLCFGGGIENGKTCINMPFVRVNPEGQVYLDILNAPYVAADLPWKLVIGSPGRAHTQEGGMGNSLSVSRNDIVPLGREMHMFRAKAREDLFDQLHTLVRSSVPNNGQWLTSRVDVWAMQGVAAYDFDIGWEVFLECGNFGGLA